MVLHQRWNLWISRPLFTIKISMFTRVFTIATIYFHFVSLIREIWKNICKSGKNQESSYMPYLTLRDKISQNLAYLEANSHKIFQISQNFQIILQHILWRNNHKSHFVVFILSFLHLNKGFYLFWWSLKVIFVKNLTEFCQISLKNLPYLTDFSPQLMACMKVLFFIKNK